MHSKHGEDEAERARQEIAQRGLPQRDPAMLDKNAKKTEITGEQTTHDQRGNAPDIEVMQRLSDITGRKGIVMVEMGIKGGGKKGIIWR